MTRDAATDPTQHPNLLLRPEDLPRVALESMNAVHAEEIECINRLAALFQLAAAGESVTHAIDGHLQQLLNHVHSHFSGEEAMMQRHGFPPYPVHKAEHDRVYDKLRSAIEGWLDDRDLHGIQNYICETLPAWMIQHIATMDRVTAQFLSQFHEE